MIEINAVCAGYGRHKVLHEASMSFEKGCLTGVIGVNGSGKSTLLKAVLNMLPLSEGEISVDGTAIESLSRIEIARKIAYLAQGRRTPDMTVEQLVLHGRFPHLAYPRRYTAQDHYIALSAMERAGVADLARKPLHSLSGGMRQNAYIAMALAQDTDYILLDEPTTYLDIGRQLEMMRALKALASSGKGIVAVMHDLPLAFSFADRIILLDGGKAILSDAPENLYDHCAIRKAFGVSLERSADGKGYNYRLSG